MSQRELRYPIGEFVYGRKYTENQIKKSIYEIGKFPQRLIKVCKSFSVKQLDMSYRKDAWTARQLINHLSDVFINGYIRSKWLLTEDNPEIKPYNETRCSLLADSHYPVIQVSLSITENLIERWVYLLSNCSLSDFDRKIYHPEYKLLIPFSELIAMYQWHGYHHLEHLKIIKKTI